MTNDYSKIIILLDSFDLLNIHKDVFKMVQMLIMMNFI